MPESRPLSARQEQSRVAPPKRPEKGSARSIAKIVSALIIRAGWAPILVLMLHIFLSYPVNVYSIHSQTDVPMHLLGGITIAFFLSSCFAAVPVDMVSPKVRTLAEIIFVFSLTATTAVFWEFIEFATDSLFGTHALGDVNDTLQDMAFGISGAAVFLLIAARRGKLGLIRSLGK